MVDVQVHRPQAPPALHYPNPDDDGLLLHRAPPHRPNPSTEHYKVPSTNGGVKNSAPVAAPNGGTKDREYMNMAPKQNGGTNGNAVSAYMNGNANTYSHKLDSGKNNIDQYHHLNRSYSKNGLKTHEYLNLPWREQFQLSPLVFDCHCYY